MPARWFSTTDKGRCREGQVVGRDCWWRQIETVRIVNASCVDDKFMASVVGRNRSCFGACSDPRDISSDCWIKCFFDIITGDDKHPGLSRETLVGDFAAAFAPPSEGGCAEVPPCAAPCLPPCWAVPPGTPCDPKGEPTGDAALVV
eukprot:TRINITY_DN21909_c0_g1_i2.p2 TRINITY_DN21909_c0_g1~~TRINITY_DN21909_c0_g1_i2.p2  ORF type:complete len:146 (-),score=18.92 TRINITY_DN21909_c0_g1_i2:298-735(-)